MPCYEHDVSDYIDLEPDDAVLLEEAPAAEGAPIVLYAWAPRACQDATVVQSALVFRYTADLVVAVQFGSQGVCRVSKSGREALFSYLAAGSDVINVRPIPPQRAC